VNFEGFFFCGGEGGRGWFLNFQRNLSLGFAGLIFKFNGISK